MPDTDGDPPAHDPHCRYAADARALPDIVQHACTDRDGQPLRPGGACWAEARTQLVEQAREVRSPYLIGEHGPEAFYPPQRGEA